MKADVCFEKNICVQEGEGRRGYQIQKLYLGLWPMMILVGNEEGGERNERKS